MKTQEVDGCHADNWTRKRSASCPYEYDGMCAHPDIDQKDYAADQGAPEWCPLRKEPYLVQLRLGDSTR
jgi:hypothetical protein